MHALVLGRFQPLHLGHCSVIEAALSAADEVTVAIGSSQAGHTSHNPFTAAERIAMLRAVFGDRIRVAPVPDLGDPPRYARHVLDCVPGVDEVWGNNVTLDLFEDEGIPVRRTGLQSRRSWEGASIRQAMARGDGAWRVQVPPTVLPVLDEMQAWSRVANLAAADLADSLIRRMQAANLKMAVAESCTGGLLGGAVTAVAGASDVFVGGITAYSNQSKTDLLAVPRDVLERHGAVSEPVAMAMARGAREAFGSDVAVAVTGIAGPGGATQGKPVGTICIAALGPHGEVTTTHGFGGGRAEVRLASVVCALESALRVSARTDAA